jgi:hypothetical protein
MQTISRVWKNPWLGLVEQGQDWSLVCGQICGCIDERLIIRPKRPAKAIKGCLRLSKLICRSTFVEKAKKAIKGY